MRLALDTNVWIDWLVFDDPAISPLKTAQQAGHVTIVSNEACLEELKRVLAYPEFGLDQTSGEDYLSEVRRRVVRHGSEQAARPAALPRCSDPDDQKFLELARDARADWLVTRDKALHKLDRQLRAAGIRVGSPSDWSAACTSAGQGFIRSR